MQVVNLQKKKICICFRFFKKKDKITLGPNNSAIFLKDPKWFSFLFARYKFVSKMIINKKRVAEFGSAEGFAASIVAKKEVKSLDLYDFHKNHYSVSKI